MRKRRFIMRIRLIPAIFAAGLLLALDGVGGTPRYVVPPGTPGVTPGGGYTSWATAGTTIQDVVSASVDTDVISVSNGTYALWRGAQVDVGIGVTLQGFGGTVVVNGNYPLSTNRCMYIHHANAFVSGLTFSNGYSTGYGGGVYMTNGIVSNCDFVTNYAITGGGGLAMMVYASTAINCRVFYNRCTNTMNVNGGGLYMSGSGCLASNMTVFGNAALTTNSATTQGGGGVYITSGTLISSRVSNNWAIATNNGAWKTINGGGIYASGPSCLIADCTIASNQVYGTSGQTGGGIYLTGSGAVVSNCVISNNYGQAEGGGIRMAAGTLVINSTICHNRGGNEGAGIALYGGIVRDSTIGPTNWGASRGGGILFGAWSSMVSNCLIVGNQGGGGGCYFQDGNGLLCDSRVISNTSSEGGGLNLSCIGIRAYYGGRVRNCLVAYNTSLGNGGGMNIWAIGLHGGYVESCTIVSNTASTGGGVYIADQTNSMTNCIIYFNTSSGADKTDVKFQYAAETNAMDHCLFTAALSPDPTKGNLTNSNPQFASPETGNFRLKNTSPCLETGINQPWMYGGRDLDGHTRIIKGTVDMGAYEYVYQGTIFSIR